MDLTSEKASEESYRYRSGDPDMRRKRIRLKVPRTTQRKRISLRLRLLLLVFLAVMPAFGVISWSVYNNRELRLQEAENQAERIASHAAAEYGQIVEFTRDTLRRLTEEPEIRRIASSSECSQRLAEVKKLNSAFGLIGVIGLDGYTICAAVNRGRGVYLGDREYFKRALETRRFTVSGFIVGRTTGRTSMVLAEPVLDDKGEPSAVLFLSLDLGWIARQMRQMVLPPGSMVALIDGAGKVMAQYPETPSYIGQEIPELAAFLGQRASGTVKGVRIVGLDDSNRTYVSVALPHAPQASAFVRAGVPIDQITAQANEALSSDILMLAGVAALVFAAAWWFAGLLVVAPTRRLIIAAETLGRGNMDARSHLEHRGDELGELAQHFDDMAARLQRVTRAQRTLSAVNRNLLRADDEKTLLEEMCRIAVQEGGYRLAWVGYARRIGDETRIVPVALHGSGEKLKRGLVEGAPEGGEDRTAQAVRLGVTQVEDFQAGESVGRAVGEKTTSRLATVCALPLRVRGQIIGALTLYTDETGLDDAEHELLEELAADLAFGIQTLRDRHEHQRAEEKIREMAYLDDLTGLPNRALLELKCTEAVVAARDSGQPFALVAINLEHFGRIQSALGFAEADRLLKAVAQRLQEAAEPGWTLARLVADRFAILLPDTAREAAREAAERVSNEFVRPFAVAHVYADVGATLGIALYPDHGDDAALLVRRADMACVSAQSHGIGVEFYQGDSDKETPERLQLMVDLREAMEKNQLAVHFQGKISATSGEITGAEALVRWRHPTKGNVPPGAFIPLAEQTGLIKPLTHWVLEAVLRQLHAWQEQGFSLPVAINLSARSFHDHSFISTLRMQLERWRIPPRLLQLEITEGVLMGDVPLARRMLEELRALGLLVFIDDFGTGYSSLRYLASLPVDAVKIDRSFIVEMQHRREMRALVASIVDMAHKLGLEVVAEGVDAEWQADMLREFQCDHIQGFLYCLPQPPSSFRRWAADWSSSHRI